MSRYFKVSYDFCTIHPITLDTTYVHYTVVCNVDIARTSGNLPLEVSIKDNVHKRKDTKLDFSYIQTSGNKYVFKCSPYVHVQYAPCKLL